MTITIKANEDGLSGAIQANGNDVIKFDQSGITQGAPFSFRNKLINGDCRIWQRGSVAAVNNAWTYGGCDRIPVAPTGFTTATGTLLRVDTGAKYAQAANLTTTGSGNVNFEQRVESINCRDLNGKAVTFSALVFQATGGAINTTLSIVKANAADNFSAKTILGVSPAVSVQSGTYTKMTFTLTLGASDASNGVAVQVNFLGVGAVTAKDFFVGDLQLEEGEIATPFEHRPIGLELSLCQRYYVAGGAQFNVAAYGAAGNSHIFHYSLPVPMRATPTGGVSWSGGVNVNVGSQRWADTRCVEAGISAAGAGQYSAVATIQNASAEL